MRHTEFAGREPFPGFSGFRYRPVLAYEAGVSRRDPSPVLHAGGRYYVWYSRSTHDASGYQATIWYAASADGLHWEEHGQALGRGPRGAFDEHAVFTPTVMVAEGRYWLFYTAVPEPFDNAGGGPAGTRTRIGVAGAATPDGPWERTGPDPILEPSVAVERFDSHRVGRQLPRTVGRGVPALLQGPATRPATESDQDGPGRCVPSGGPLHTRHPASPVLDSGHEVCVWPHGAWHRLHRFAVRAAGRHPAVQHRRRALPARARHRPAECPRSLSRGPLAGRQRSRHFMGPVP